MPSCPIWSKPSKTTRPSSTAAPSPTSFSTDATAVGLADGHRLKIREIRLSAGAGFVVAICGDIMTMPGLPRTPAAHGIDVDEHGLLVGLS